MGFLPVPAKIFFSDFADTLSTYEVVRDHLPIASYKGMSEKDEHGQFIYFLVSDSPDIRCGDFLKLGSKQFLIKEIDYDQYLGKDELLKAYY